jgi:molybdopterin/thiamine biosynthesis adenylyltransferase
MNTEADILIVGTGGLGVPAALALARAYAAGASGLRRVGLMDPDPIELSNLHRQIIFGADDIGRSKVDAAARHLHRIAPRLAIEKFPRALDARNAREVIARFAVVIDGTDSPAAKFLINDTCIALGRPFIYGGVLAMSGQAMTVLPGESACLRCLFEEPPDADEVASCREAGILGPIAGAIAEVQAREALRIVSAEIPQLAGKILTYDGAQAPRVRVTTVNPRPGCGCRAQARRASGRAQVEGTR